VANEYYFAGDRCAECARTGIKFGGSKIWTEDVSPGRIGVENCHGI
jgi:hypothetical protein